jgi:choline dehydrogenase-like flavoprotein
MADRRQSTRAIPRSSGQPSVRHTLPPVVETKHVLQRTNSVFRSIEKMWDAFKTIPGVDFPREHAAGQAVGVFWCPNSIDPSTRTRSYAKLGHHDNAGGASSRSNFHLLPGHRVIQLVMGERVDASKNTWVAGGVLITPRDGAMPADGPLKIFAKREIVLSAGTIHTPQVLQRSGIGPRDVLQAAGAKVRLELPGVGWNMQDHMHYQIAFKCKLYC